MIPARTGNGGKRGDGDDDDGNNYGNNDER